MDVIVRSNNYPLNDMTALMSGRIIDLDTVMKTKSNHRLFCLSKWIFMSPTRQTNPGR